MDKNNGWNRVEIKDVGDMEAWCQGFFPTAHSGKRKWIRNFVELRLRDLALFALGDVEDKTIYDVGCGAGMYLMTFIKMGAKHVGGVDIVENYVNIAKKNVRDLGADDKDIVNVSCTDIPFPDNYFDKVFSGDVFEHIDRDTKDKCIAEAYRVLKPGGCFVIKTPNLNYLKKTLFLRRVKALLTFKNPFKIFIAHTNNNPDNEHHGLTTHAELTELFLKNTFHTPEVFHQKLYGRKLPNWLLSWLEKKDGYNETIVIKATKPIFLALYP